MGKSWEKYGKNYRETKDRLQSPQYNLVIESSRNNLQNRRSKSICLPLIVPTELTQIIPCTYFIPSVGIGFKPILIRMENRNKVPTTASEDKFLTLNPIDDSSRNDNPTPK